MQFWWVPLPYLPACWSVLLLHLVWCWNPPVYFSVQLLFCSALWHLFDTLCFLIFFFLFWLYPQHAEVPRPGTKSTLELWPVPQLQQSQILKLVCQKGTPICFLALYWSSYSVNPLFQVQSASLLPSLWIPYQVDCLSPYIKIFFWGSVCSFIWNVFICFLILLDSLCLLLS